jgi:hypothetical protein
VAAVALVGLSLIAAMPTSGLRATDAASNRDPTPASETRSMIALAPNTRIASGPSGTVAATSTHFSFSAAGIRSTFECRLDGGAFASCNSPKSYSSLADGAHTFKVRAKDSANNADQTPASRTWTIDTTTPGRVFSDDFESGTLAAWRIATGANGTAAAKMTKVKTGTFAARLTESANAGSFAYARRAFATRLTDFTVTGDFTTLQEGGSAGNAPQLRLLDARGARIVGLYRQNATRGQLWVNQNGTRVKTTGRLPIRQWRKVELRVKIAGAASIVQVTVNGAQVYATSKANLRASAVKTLQLGNDTAAQRSAIAVDNVSVRAGG